MQITNGWSLDQILDAPPRLLDWFLGFARIESEVAADQIQKARAAHG